MSEDEKVFGALKLSAQHELRISTFHDPVFGVRLRLWTRGPDPRPSQLAHFTLRAHHLPPLRMSVADCEREACWVSALDPSIYAELGLQAPTELASKPAKWRASLASDACQLSTRSIEAIQDCLSLTQLRSLEESCPHFDLRFWPITPALRAATVFTAAHRVVVKYEALGLTREQSIRSAAEYLGLEPSHVKTLVNRGRPARLAPASTAA